MAPEGSNGPEWCVNEQAQNDGWQGRHNTRGKGSARAITQQVVRWVTLGHAVG